MSARSLQELVVWQRAIELATSLYELTREYPGREIYGLTSQLRRAGVSVASNIAEGYGRASRREYRNFLSIARGSTLEIQTQLVLSRRLGFGDERHLSRAEEIADETSRLLWAVIQKL